MGKKGEVDYSQYYVKNYVKDYRPHASDGDVIDLGEPDMIDYEPQVAGVGKERKRTYGSPTKIKKKSFWRRTMIAVTSILLCFAITILLADTITGGYVLEELQTVLTGKSNVRKTYYAVECANFTDMQTAKVYANGLRKKGGAGYVLSDNGVYRVFVETYAAEKDADSIAKQLRLDGEQSKVFPLPIYDVDYMKFPSNTRNIVKSVITYVDAVYSELYGIGVDYVQNKIDENSAVSKISGLEKKVNNILVEFEANCDNKADDINIVKIRVQLSAVCSSLANLAGKTVQRANLICDIRYTTCMIVNSHRLLCEELKA